MKVHLKYEVKKMLTKNELTWNTRWGQNVFDKVNMKIF